MRVNPNQIFYLCVCTRGRVRALFSDRTSNLMKKVLLVVAACLAATPAVAQRYGGGGGTSTYTNNSSSTYASRGGVANSARVEQSAGALAFSLLAQGERAEIEAPRYDPYLRVDGGAFVMPYINESFNASRGGDVRVYDPVGAFSDSTVINEGTIP